MARALLDAGAAVDMVNNFGETALMFAVRALFVDQIREECHAKGVVDDDSDEVSDADDGRARTAIRGEASAEVRAQA